MSDDPEIDLELIASPTRRGDAYRIMAALRLAVLQQSKAIAAVMEGDDDKAMEALHRSFEFSERTGGLLHRLVYGEAPQTADEGGE